MLHDIWQFFMEDNHDAVVLQFDQSAAYDIICHNKLPYKLWVIGLDTVSWFASYMTKCQQVVHIRLTSLMTGDISVFQGSIISCLLYLIHNGPPINAPQTTPQHTAGLKLEPAHKCNVCGCGHQQSKDRRWTNRLTDGPFPNKHEDHTTIYVSQ